MYQQLATKLTLSNVSGTSSQSEDVSPAVSMAGANCVQFEVDVITLTSGGTLEFTLQLSNDLQNWTDSSATPETTTAVGMLVGAAIPDIGCAYVRLKYAITVGSSITACMAANLNTSAQ